MVKSPLPKPGKDPESRDDRHVPRLISFIRSRVLQSSKVRVRDAMTYTISDLSSWSSILIVTKTVWVRRSLWMTFAVQLALSTIVALLTGLMVTDPGRLQISKFTLISKFLRAFVGFLLGFFMASSIKRWWNCADGFLELFDSVRDLQVQLYSLGVDDDQVDNVLRYGVVSAFITQETLYAHTLPDEANEKAQTNMWLRLVQGNALDQDLPTYTHLHQAERQELQMVADAASFLWLWVAQFIARMADSGDVPGKASPTYGRLQQLTADALGGMRKIRAAIMVQAPYIYVQMLAALVHLNNIVNAVSFGMIWGSAAAANFVHEKVELPMADAADQSPKSVSEKRDAQNGQTLLVSFMFSCFGPFVYQALLEVSVVIAQPFSSEDGQIPTERLLKHLVTDLNNGKFMAHNLPWGKRPRFKKESA